MLGFKRLYWVEINLIILKKQDIQIQANIPNTRVILMKANTDCKDMYNILISRKKEEIKAVHKRYDENLDFVNRNGFTFLSSRSKLQRNHWL